MSRSSATWLSSSSSSLRWPCRRNAANNQHPQHFQRQDRPARTTRRRQPTWPTSRGPAPSGTTMCSWSTCSRRTWTPSGTPQRVRYPESHEIVTQLVLLLNHMLVWRTLSLSGGRLIWSVHPAYIWQVSPTSLRPHDRPAAGMSNRLCVDVDLPPCSLLLMEGIKRSRQDRCGDDGSTSAGARTTLSWSSPAWWPRTALCSWPGAVAIRVRPLNWRGCRARSPAPLTVRLESRFCVRYDQLLIGCVLFFSGKCQQISSWCTQSAFMRRRCWHRIPSCRWFR